MRSRETMPSKGSSLYAIDFGVRMRVRKAMAWHIFHPFQYPFHPFFPSVQSVEILTGLP
jgi:hypothetical protein